ncbi:hypothetical protein EMCG_01854, partial [[Emmonsia] crescens]
MSKGMKPNGKAPAFAAAQPPLNTPIAEGLQHCVAQQPVTMRHLQQLLIDIFHEVKKSPDSPEPTEATKPEQSKYKEGNEVKARASKLEFKEVHEVWDKDKSNYKIVESVREDEALDDLDQYIFVVRKQLDRMTKETRAFVDIKSTALLDVLREILRGVRAISLREDKPS